MCKKLCRNDVEYKKMEEKKKECSERKLFSRACKRVKIYSLIIVIVVIDRGGWPEIPRTGEKIDDVAWTREW